MGCGGGGVHCHGNGSSPTFAYNLIYGNTAEDEGGGFLAYGGCTPILINNTITENSCNLDGGGITSIGVWGDSDITGYNNIVYGNLANNNPDWYTYWDGYIHLDYTCSGNMLNGTGNITDDPLFNDPLNWDFNLLVDSPCIDAGDPTSPLDPDGTIADMGALYHDQETGIEEQQGSTNPVEFVLYQAYPNPFNPATMLSYNLPQAELVSLKVYSISGTLVNTLVDGWRDAGVHQFTFEASGLASGVYFVHFTAGDLQQTQKLMLVK